MWKTETKEEQTEEEIPTMTLEVDTQLAFTLDSKKLKKRTLRFTLQDTAVTITETSTNGIETQIGEIIGSMGGTIEIKDSIANETWVIRPLDLWKAFAKAKKEASEKQLKGKTQPCPYCKNPIPDSGVFGLPTYTDVPENHKEGCPIKEVMEVRMAELERGTHENKV